MNQSFSNSLSESYAYILNYKGSAKIQLPLETKKSQNSQSTSILKSPISNHKQQYLSFFQQIEQQTDLLIHQSLINDQQKLHHNLTIMNKNERISDLISFKKPVIYIIGHNYGATIIKYQVIIGNYKISINLLNLNFDAPYQKIIGKGGYGKIFVINYAKEKQMAAKRLSFHNYFKIQINKNNIYPNKQDIEEIICEYAIYKICSFYKIGPKIIHEFGFDLVCFDNCIEFYMEYCMTVKKWHQKMEKWLKIALRLLHKLKIIHKDFKPQNILYSTAYQKFVLCDFGISHSVQQQVGQMTKTYQQGSLRYMSPQMRKIKQKQRQYIDLYFNDVYGLRVTLQAFEQQKMKGQFQVEVHTKREQQPIKQKKQNIYEIIHFFSKIINRQKQSVDQLLQFLQARFNQVESFFKLIINSQIKIILNEFEKLRNLNEKIVVNTEDQKKQKVCYLIRVYGISQLLYEEIYFIIHSDFKDLVVKKIKQTKQNPTDPKYWLNLAKLSKNTSFQFKLKREITALESYNSQKSQILLQKYLQLFFIRIKKPSVQPIEVIDIYKKLVEQYKQRDKNDTYQFVVILFKLISNPKQNFENQILKFISKYPLKEFELLEILVIIYRINKYTVNYYVRILKFYNGAQNILLKWKILNSITNHFFMQNQQMNFKFFLNKFQASVNYHANQLKQDQPLSIEINFYLGNFQIWKYNYQSALKYLQTSALKQKLFNGEISNQMANILFRIGYTYFLMKKYKQAQVKIKQSLDLFRLYLSNSSYNFEIDLIYYYLVIIYFNINNTQSFNYYLKLFLYESNNKKIERIINYHFNNNTSIIDEPNIKNLVQQLQTIVSNNQIRMQISKQYQINFKNHLSFYNKKCHFVKMLQKNVSPQNQHLFKSLIQQIQEIQPYLQSLYGLIATILIQDHKKTYCCLNKFLQLEQINSSLNLNYQILYQLYQCIQIRYYISRFFNICERYLIKQFKILLNHKMVHKYSCWISKVLDLVEIIKTIDLVILLSWKQFGRNKIHQSAIYQNVMKYYLSRCQIKKAEIYHINHQKRKKWDLDSYSNSVYFYYMVKNIENCMIFLCYLQIYFKKYMKNKQFRVKRKQSLISIYNAIFQQKQFPNQDLETIFKRLKMSKKCLYLKTRIGCLKYLKLKNLKKKIKYFITQLK